MTVATLRSIGALSMSLCLALAASPALGSGDGGGTCPTVPNPCAAPAFTGLDGTWTSNEVDISSNPQCNETNSRIVTVTQSGSTITTTGVPLPFISHGGSSLVTTLTACGLILNVSQHG